MSESRTKASIRNSGTSVLAQTASIVLDFIGRTFFIKFLNVDYLGVNGLFANIITLLSLAELGVGTAIVYMMYKPIAEGDEKKVAAYNQLFRKIYNAIGIFIICVGLCVIPFLNSIIRSTPDITENLSIVYVLFLLNTSVSYFYTYKRSLLIAHQKEYLNNKNIILFAIIKDVSLIILLYLFHNYYIYLGAQIVITFMSNIAISQLVNKLYPQYVHEKGGEISKVELRTIVKNTMGMVCHKIGSVIVSGTDNILISSFVGISTVGVFSNYKMIQKVSSSIISRGVNSVTASVGQLAAISDGAKVLQVFKRIYFINLSLTYFLTVFFYALVDSFIRIWIGEAFLLDSLSVFIIAVNLFFNQVRVPSQVIINSYGVFWEVRWKSIVEVIVNLSSSLFLCYVMDMGLPGILAGTILSNITTNLWWEPFAAYRYGMHQKVRYYYLRFIKDVIVLFLTLFLIRFINTYMNLYVKGDISLFISEFVTSLFCSVILFAVFYHKEEDFQKIIVKFVHLKVK